MEWEVLACSSSKTISSRSLRVACTSPRGRQSSSSTPTTRAISTTASLTSMEPNWPQSTAMASCKFRPSKMEPKIVFAYSMPTTGLPGRWLGRTLSTRVSLQLVATTIKSKFSDVTTTAIGKTAFSVRTSSHQSIALRGRPGSTG